MINIEKLEKEIAERLKPLDLDKIILYNIIGLKMRKEEDYV